MTYTVTVRWSKGEDEAFSDNKYSRRHSWIFDGGAEVEASASPHVVPVPYACESAVDPEEAFIASLSSCHMLWFLSLAAMKGLVVESYEDEAEGVLDKDGDGRLMMTKVTLRPKIEFGGDNQPTNEEVEALHEAAHDKCFIANSVKTVVTVEQ
jgi:organic hydroperoxide reductase OsmC/OhrA